MIGILEFWNELRKVFFIMFFIPSDIKRAAESVISLPSLNDNSTTESILKLRHVHEIFISSRYIFNN